MWFHKDPDTSLSVERNNALFGKMALFQIMSSWLSTHNGPETVTNLAISRN